MGACDPPTRRHAQVSRPRFHEGARMSAYNTVSSETVSSENPSTLGRAASCIAGLLLRAAERLGAKKRLGAQKDLERKKTRGAKGENHEASPYRARARSSAVDFVACPRR